MTGFKTEIEAHSIVLVGDFNPKIFQPAWFAAQNLIRQEEADAAKIEIIHPEIVRFSLDWLNLEVVHERFNAGTQQFPYFEVLRDLVVGTFKVLRHTPVRQMGINREMHVRMNSEDEWHAFGHMLAPKEIWNGVISKPGLSSLTMQGERPDENKGYVNVKVEPSKRIRPGVYFQINDHYEIKEPEKSLGCDPMMELLDRSWKSSIQASEKIAVMLLEKK